MQINNFDLNKLGNLEENIILNSSFIKNIESIVRAENIENSNANMDEKSFSGRKYKASGELHKLIALKKMISPIILKSYEENKIYIHDLDSYSVGMHNCMFIDLKDILERGFEVRNGDVRTPTSITTAYQLVAVIFQIQS